MMFAYFPKVRGRAPPNRYQGARSQCNSHHGLRRLHYFAFCGPNCNTVIKMNTIEIFLKYDGFKSSK